MYSSRTYPIIDSLASVRTFRLSITFITNIFFKFLFQAHGRSAAISHPFWFVEFMKELQYTASTSTNLAYAQIYIWKIEVAYMRLVVVVQRVPSTVGRCTRPANKTLKNMIPLYYAARSRNTQQQHPQTQSTAASMFIYFLLIPRAPIK